MIYNEGGVEVELRYFLGGVGDPKRKTETLIFSKSPQNRVSA